MKQLTCEMCGSTDLLKQDGVFVCQFCGCKYSVEEARKMMIEGTVDVSGSTIKVDNSAFVENNLLNARRAKQNKDWEETEKYYNMVQQYAPTNTEAIFGSYYAKAMSTLANRNLEKSQAVFKVFQNSISVIDANYSIEQEEKGLAIIEEITSDIINMENYVGSFGTSFAAQPFLHLIGDLCREYVISLNKIIEKYDTSERQRVKNIMLMVIKICELKRDKIDIFADETNFSNNRIVRMHTLIKEFEPNHPVPAFETKACYVATAVYGSYDCPQVWTLRRFRDYTLAETWYGRAFIHTYYAISPTLVKWFGHTAWFKKMWKGTLDRMVASLNSSGVEATPYEDRRW